MDSLSFASLFGFSGGLAETLIYMIAALVVLRLELQRRAGQEANDGGRGTGRYRENCKRLLRQFAPEAAGVVACLTLAVALRAKGLKVQPNDGLSQEAWDHIQEQWPLLMTADTLLSLQAMLRLVVIMSVAFRAGTGGGPVPLSAEASAFWLCGGLARVALFVRSPVYRLDGPLGGMLPAACELAVLPLLLILGWHALRRAPMTWLAFVAAVVSFAYRNHLSLSESAIDNSLFIVAHCFDLLTALAYVLRTMLIEDSVGPKGSRGGSVAVAFAHLLMPVQQCLSTYYFFQAMDIVDDLVGAGSPFVVLQVGNLVQLGAYFGAVTLYIAELAENRAGPEVGSHQSTIAGPVGTLQQVMAL